MRKHPMRYYSHRGRRSHPTTLFHRFVSAILLPLALIAVAGFAASGAVFVFHPYQLDVPSLLLALGASVIRLLVAYALSLVIGIPLGVLAEGNRRIESVLLPIYDVLESIPVLAFFPIIILFFLRSGALEGAALFMLFFSMIWSIVFSTIGGLKVIPRDIRAVGKVFGFSRVQQFFSIELPALFPYLVTGSILALAAGWNIVIVAEALHVYAPQSSGAHDLFGIGSILVSAATTGNESLLLSAMGLLVIIIALINILVWQPLLSRAERYKFE